MLRTPQSDTWTGLSRHVSHVTLDLDRVGAETEALYTCLLYTWPTKRSFSDQIDDTLNMDFIT